MKRFPEVYLAEGVTASYPVGEVPQVREGELVQLGLEVQRPEVTHRAEESVAFWREM